MSGEGETSLNHDPGHYNFVVRPGLQDKDDDHPLTQKNVEFIFSTKFDRLYVKKFAICPFGISTSDVPPVGSNIKVLVYSKDEVPVMRCPAHTKAEQEGVQFISPWHFMRCDNDLGTYHCDENGELSIILPYSKPECVPENVENIVFLCSSKNCIKKELFIKFSLINSDEILGYQNFGLHVCSSPGRDRFNHETEKIGTGKKKRKINCESAGISAPGCSTENTPSPSQEPYKMLVKKKWIYDYCAKINRALELMEAVPHEDQEKYLRRYRAKQAAASHTATASTSSSNTRTTLRRIVVKC